MSQRKSPSWFANQLAALNARLKSLTHFKMKAEQTNDDERAKAIDKEIGATKTTIFRTQLLSNFAEPTEQK